MMLTLSVVVVVNTHFRERLSTQQLVRWQHSSLGQVFTEIREDV